jgi:hypothetical protein
MELVKVFTAAGELEAEMVKGFLEAQGIKVMLVQESIGRTYGLTVGILGEVKLLVPDHQVADAKALLQKMEDGDFEDIEFSDNDEDETEDD